MKLCNYVIIILFVGILYHLSKIYHLNVEEIYQIYVKSYANTKIRYRLQAK